MDILNRIKKTSVGSKIAGIMPPALKGSIRNTYEAMRAPSKLDRAIAQASQANDLLARLLYEQAFSTPRFHEPKRLLPHGFKVYPQHDEDGIIEEIFDRIGVTDRFFVEFGVGDGLENCTTYLLLKGWSGAWIDGSAECYRRILQNCAFLLKEERLRVKHSFITAENIEDLFSGLSVPEEFDFLSIDIDRNDYWVWNGIGHYRPRVVAIEYNASFKQSASVVVPYDPQAI